jgi:hypothetical protein
LNTTVLPVASAGSQQARFGRGVPARLAHFASDQQRELVDPLGGDTREAVEHGRARLDPRVAPARKRLAGALHRRRDIVCTRHRKASDHVGRIRRRDAFEEVGHSSSALRAGA